MGEPAAAVSPSIEHLEAAWASILELCSDLTEEQWKTPTGCPGWTVQDNIAHLVDYEAGALGRTRPDVSVAEREHLKNALGESNEIGVEARRSRSGAEVLDELRDVTADRSAQLRAMTADDLTEEIPTPAGRGTVADMLTLRVMDTWSHEQDIRRALGRPGHASGPAVDESVGYWSQFLPFVVGKKAGAADGVSVRFEVGEQRIDVVVDGRAKLVDGLDGEPTATVAMSATTFAAHVGGRTDAPADVTLTGDADLGQRVVDNLGFMP